MSWGSFHFAVSIVSARICLRTKGKGGGWRYDFSTNKLKIRKVWGFSSFYSILFLLYSFDGGWTRTRSWNWNPQNVYQQNKLFVNFYFQSSFICNINIKNINVSIRISWANRIKMKLNFRHLWNTWHGMAKRIPWNTRWRCLIMHNTIIHNYWYLL